MGKQSPPQGDVVLYPELPGDLRLGPNACAIVHLPDHGRGDEPEHRVWRLPHLGNGPSVARADLYTALV